jgi:hypothetical protein
MSARSTLVQHTQNYLAFSPQQINIFNNLFYFGTIMPSHAISSSANLIKQLQPPFSVTSSIPSTAAHSEGDELQDKLSHIANQPTNLGHGCGVALRKAIDNAEALCKSLSTHLYKTSPGFLDFLFSNNQPYTVINSISKNADNALILSQCMGHVAKLKELENNDEKPTHTIKASK